MMEAEVVDKPTVKVSNLPTTAIANELQTFLETQLGPNSVYAIDIPTERKNWKPRTFGRVQFSSFEFKSKIQSLSANNKLIFKSQCLQISEAFDDIIPRPVNPNNRFEKGILDVGFMSEDKCLCVLESFDKVRMWVMPERKRVEYWVWLAGECYKLEIQFEDLLEVVGCCLGGATQVNGLLLTFRYGPRIYRRVSGPNVASYFTNDSYHICKDNFDFLWVRTTDFSVKKSLGHSTSFCWDLGEGSFSSELLSSFPYLRDDTIDLILEDGKEFCCASEIVPVLNNGSDSLAYEIFYQLNCLVHTQKLSFSAVDTDLLQILHGINNDTARIIIQKFHKLKSICFDPISFIKTQMHILNRNSKKASSSSPKRLEDQNLMSCHRVLITPSKIYCLGPELETSNYVVKHFASYESDFIRVTFVEENWGKLSINAVSTSIYKGLYAKPSRTAIYNRILTILRDGVVIGPKRFEFLAFSASQLRSNSVWMFASNETVTAANIREWMGSYNKIRSVSKCAARMGQLFSSSVQTLNVSAREVDLIPDIEVSYEGNNYCFSDGIGKISLSFAKLVAQKCGVRPVPSAFQIRYGGYKGVIAVDRNSFRKLSLRKSMLKFESENTMLNVTSWSESMPSYLNREIVTLLSTLGVNDEAFESLQQTQLDLLRNMLTNRDAALNVLEGLGGAGCKNIMVKMLRRGYEPNVEPYLSLLIQAFYESMMVDLRTRCRIYVPKGRILIGCLDETGVLDYGQVYIRITMTEPELKGADQSFFRKIDDTTSVIVGKVVVTKNPCLHPGDIRVLDAIYQEELEEKGLVDCLVFPQKGIRPHPNECSGGDLDGDLFFISWDKDIVPCQTVTPMDYIGRRPRIMDHDVTLEEIQRFFVDYMINDSLGGISTAHLVHSDCEPDKANSKKCLELASLHSMAVDYAKTGAPAELPSDLKPKAFPDFMERPEKQMYASSGVLGKLYRATLLSTDQESSSFNWYEKTGESYDNFLEVEGFEEFIEAAEAHREMYTEKLSTLMTYYGAKTEIEILTGNLQTKEGYLQRDNRRYGEMKDRILLSVKNLQKEAKQWFDDGCNPEEHQKMASAWYHVTYQSSYCHKDINCLSFPWILADTLFNIRDVNMSSMSM